MLVIVSLESLRFPFFRSSIMNKNERKLQICSLNWVVNVKISTRINVVDLGINVTNFISYIYSRRLESLPGWLVGV